VPHRVGESPGDYFANLDITSTATERSEAGLRDTLYWGAVSHPHDQYRAQLIRSVGASGKSLSYDCRSAYGFWTAWLECALSAERPPCGPDILDDRRVTVLSRNRVVFSFWRIVVLYEPRL